MSSEEKPTTKTNPETEETKAQADVTAAEEVVDTQEPEIMQENDNSTDAVSGLMEQLDAITAEANANKERYLRALADLENFRKRAIRDKEDARKNANIGLVEELVPVLDNFQLGLQSAKQHEGGDAFAQGFQMILTQLQNVLKQNGVEEINPSGQAFDPNFHESVAHVDSDDVEEGHIAEVHRVGYQLNGRLIRPATVVVSNGPASAEAK